MVKKCDITGTGVMSGNSVSHANNHNRRRFMPNLQVVSLFSEALNKVFKLKICSKTLRSIEHNGGLDSYLESTSGNKLSEEALKIKKAVARKKARLPNRLLPLPEKPFRPALPKRLPKLLNSFAYNKIA